MRLIEQILDEFGADGLKSVTLVFGQCCYLKSVKSVLCFSPNQIVLSVGKSSVCVEGEELTVGEYFEGDLLIKGNVRSVKVG